MNIKNISSFLIIFSFFIYSCGFTPQYAGFKNLKFDLILFEFDGDRDLNNEINSQIRRYDRDRKNTIKVKVSYNSRYEKIALSRDTKGEATKYKLTANINFEIDFKDYTKNIFFNDEFNIDKIDDKIEENNYIKIVKRDFAERAIEKLILSINQEK